MSRVLKRPRRIAREGDEEHWIPLSDLMTSLMFLFLLIALAYMVQVNQQSTQTLRIIDDYRLQHDALYTELEREFHRDFRTWDAELTPDLTIQFHRPDVLFKPGSAALEPRYQTILSDFFPRYVRILDSPRFRDVANQLRIEGSAPSASLSGNASAAAYVANMELSQDRAREVLRYVLLLPKIQGHAGWLEAHVAADGLSSSHPILVNGKVDEALSERVDFRVVDSLWDRVAPTASVSRNLTASRVTAPSALPYSLDEVVTPNAEPAYVNLDPHPIVAIDTRQAVSIIGWATNRSRTQPAAAVFARVDGARRIAAKYGDLRDDVALALHEPALNHVGFTIDLPPKSLSPGVHHLDIIVVNASGESDLVARDRLTLDAR